MTGIDPLERLRSVGLTEEEPDGSFASDLRATLMAQLDDRAAPVVEGIVVEGPARRRPSRTRGIVGLAAAAAVIAVIVIALALNSGDDDGSLITTEITPSVQPTATPAPDAGPPPTETQLLGQAEAFLDALYANDQSGLFETAAEDADLGVFLFVQGWAEGLNYEVIDRSCEPGGSGVVCSVTASDDLSVALGIGDVTDEYRFLFRDGGISTAVTNSDAPFLLQDLYTWVRITSPEVYDEDGPCAGFFDGGPTAAACAQVMLDSVPAFMETDTYLDFVEAGS